MDTSASSRKVKQLTFFWRCRRCGRLFLAPWPRRWHFLGRHIATNLLIATLAAAVLFTAIAVSNALKPSEPSPDTIDGKPARWWRGMVGPKQ